MLAGISRLQTRDRPLLFDDKVIKTTTDVKLDSAFADRLACSQSNMEITMKSMTRRVVALLLCPNETNASISRKVEKHRDTIRNMRTNLGLSGLSRPELDDLGDAALEELIVGKKKQKPRFLEPDLDAILLELRKPGVTRKLLFEEYLAAAEHAGPEELGPIEPPLVCRRPRSKDTGLWKRRTLERDIQTNCARELCVWSWITRANIE
ncbi:MAG: hypothetical protein ABJL72_08235, partial [Roseobacter sp.]